MKGHRLVKRQSRGFVFFGLLVSFLLIVCLTASLAFAQVTGDSRNVTEPVFPPTCTVLQATQPAGSTMDETRVSSDTTLIQNAINNCPAGQAVELQANGANNAFIISPIKLAKGVTLLVDAEVTVFASLNPADYPSYTGEMIGGSSVTGAGVMGYGIIDGRGGWVFPASATNIPACGSSPCTSWWQYGNVTGNDRPRIINVTADNFTLYKITLQNSPMFHFTGGGSNFIAWGAKITAPGATTCTGGTAALPCESPNTDGIDPDALSTSGSSNVTITHTFISNGDDNVAVGLTRGKLSNVTVSHNHFFQGHGMSVGSGTTYGLNNMLVTDLVIDGSYASSHNSIRIKSYPTSGGLVQNVLYDSVCLLNGGHSLFFDPYYEDQYGTTGIPQFYNITVHNLHGLPPVAGNGSSYNVMRGYRYSASKVLAANSYPLTLTLDNVVLEGYQTKDFVGTYDGTAYVDNTKFTFGPGPVNFASVIENTIAPSNSSVTYTDNQSTVNPPAPYNCTGKYVYLAAELFAPSNIVSPNSPLTLTAILQPIVYGSPAPTGTITLYDNGAPVSSPVTISAPAQSFPGSSPRSITYFNIPSVSPGQHVYTAQYSGDSNYAASTYVSLPEFPSFTITTATGTVVKAIVTAANKTYDGTNNASFSSCTLTGVLAGDTGNVTCTVATGTFASANVGTNITVTATGISLSGSAAGNYVLSNTSAISYANITKALVAPSITAAGKTYDTTTTEPVANVVCNPNVLPVDAGNVTCSVSAASFASANAGNGITVTATGIALTGSAVGNYALSSMSAATTANIVPATPTLTLTCNSVMTSGNPQACSPGGSATGIGGAAVAGSWTYTYNGSFTVPSAAATYTVVGTFTSSNPNYASGGTATGSFVIGGEPTVTVTLSCPTATYDGTAHTCTATPTPGTASCSPLAPETNAGSYPESVTCTNAGYLAGSATGTLVINPATPTLSVTCTEVTYDGSPHTCAGSATGVSGAGSENAKVHRLIQVAVLPPTVSGTFGCVPASETNAGTYPVTCTFTSSDPNYASGGTASGLLVINPATLSPTLTCTSVVANGNPQACSPGGQATGIGGAAVAGTWTYTYNGSATVPSAASTYTVVGTFTSSDPNYASGGAATGSFVIGTEPTVTVTLSCPAATYDGTAHSCTATPTPGTASCSGLVSETNAGTYPESVTCTNAGYLAGTATGSLVISPATPALSATCAGGVYNGTPNSCTGSATGVGGAAVTGSFAFAPGSETNAGSYPETGTFTSTNSNYVSGGTASATLVITAATPTLSLTCNSVTANGSPQACSPGGSATGVGGAAVSGTWTYTYNGSATVPSAAATYTVVGTFTSTNTNYVSGGTASGPFVINPVPTGTVSLTLSTTAVTFPGSIMIGQSSQAQYVTIMSTGTASLQVSGVTIGGANPGDFIVTNQAGTCTTGATLVNHADCNLRVVFAPTAVGSRSAILYISDNLAGSPQQVTVSGTAISGAQLTLSVTTLTFPSTTVGATAATQYITLKSTGFQPVVVNQVVLSSGDFDLSDQAGTCTTAAATSLVPGADCNIRVKFHPTATGARTASVVISSNSPASPQSVSLNGTGQ